MISNKNMTSKPKIISRRFKALKRGNLPSKYYKEIIKALSSTENQALCSIVHHASPNKIATKK